MKGWERRARAKIAALWETQERRARALYGALPERGVADDSRAAMTAFWTTAVRDVLWDGNSSNGGDGGGSKGAGEEEGDETAFSVSLSELLDVFQHGAMRPLCLRDVLLNEMALSEPAIVVPFELPRNLSQPPSLPHTPSSSSSSPSSIGWALGSLWSVVTSAFRGARKETATAPTREAARWLREDEEGGQRFVLRETVERLASALEDELKSKSLFLSDSVVSVEDVLRDSEALHMLQDEGSKRFIVWHLVRSRRLVPLLVPASSSGLQSQREASSSGDTEEAKTNVVVDRVDVFLLVIGARGSTDTTDSRVFEGVAELKATSRALGARAADLERRIELQRRKATEELRRGRSDGTGMGRKRALRLLGAVKSAEQRAETLLDAVAKIEEVLETINQTEGEARLMSCLRGGNEALAALCREHNLTVEAVEDVLDTLCELSHDQLLIDRALCTPFRAVPLASSPSASSQTRREGLSIEGSRAADLEEDAALEKELAELLATLPSTDTEDVPLPPSPPSSSSSSSSSSLSPSLLETETPL